MRKIILDTDPGIDDAVAIIAASFIKEFETRTTGERLGQTICDLSNEKSENPNIFVAVEVNSEEYKKQFVKLVFPDIYHNFVEYVLD